MIRLLKYLRGYLRIKVWGFSPERFMNLCSAHNILLWDIKHDQSIFEMCISLKGFYKLRPIARKTGTKVAILKRVGLPFFVPKILSKKVFLLGLFLSIAFWIVSTFFVWKIELSGNLRITDDLFMSFLDEQQIRIGISKSSLDLAALEKLIRKTFPEITWVSTKVEGTNLLITVKENDAPILPTQDETKEIGSHLVSTVQGVVVSMIVRSGVPQVSIGDPIEVGTILVSGQIPIYNDDATIRSYEYVDADADLVIEHVLTHEETLPYDYIQRVYTGREKRKYFLRFREKELRSIQEINYPYYDSIMTPIQPELLLDLHIPLQWGYYRYREYQNVEHEYSLDEAQNLLTQKLQTFMTELVEKGVQIISKNVRMDTVGGQWVIGAELLVREPAMESVQIPKEPVPLPPDE
jgi:similar to stage IV sporulation protein